ncbi:MAG TPA: hypothetical protein VIF15_21200 [Polyangiaceae bacterium]
MSARLLLALGVLSLALAALEACGSDGGAGAQGGGDDASTPDGGRDSGAADTAAVDSTATDGAGGDGAGSDGASGDGASGDSAHDAVANDVVTGDVVTGDVVTGDAAGDSAAADTGGSDDSASDGGAVDATGDGNDGASIQDAGSGDGNDGSSVGVITGGPCASGAAGATAFRIKWIDAGGTAVVSYEVDGLPDKSQDTAGAYGYQIGFTPSYVDPFLAQGGLGLDSSDFVDIHLSTVGLASITTATLSIYGRSYDVSASGSFNWQTFDGTGQTPTDFVSNVPPYQWYSADMTTEIAPGEGNALVRIKAGPSSGALVVNQIEICMVAN